MAKRGRLEIIRDILTLVKNTHKIKPTPLLRRSNLSSSRFKTYYLDLQEKGFIKEMGEKNKKYVELTEKGYRFIEKYRSIIGFIEEFEL